MSCREECVLASFVLRRTWWSQLQARQNISGPHLETLVYIHLMLNHVLLVGAAYQLPFPPRIPHCSTVHALTGNQSEPMTLSKASQALLHRALVTEEAAQQDAPQYLMSYTRSDRAAGTMGRMGCDLRRTELSV